MGKSTMLSSERSERFFCRQNRGGIPRRKFITTLTAASLCVSTLTKLGKAASLTPVMRLACQTNAWPFESGLAGLIPVLKIIKSLGFQGYETSYRNVQEAFSDPEPARTELEETGLVCAGVHIAGPSLYEEATGIPSIDFLKRIAAGSSALGAEYIVLSGHGVGEVDGKLNQDKLKRKIEALTETAQYCKDVGLTLAYHNHADDFLQNGAEIDAILSSRRSDLIRVWYCLHNAERAGAKAIEYFSNRHESIPGIHLTNIRDTTASGHPFDGEVLLKEIEMVDWKGWLVIEEERTHERPDWPQTAVIKKARQYVRQVFGL